MSAREANRVALVFRGDRSRGQSDRIENSRLAPVAAALADVGLRAELAPFSEAVADDVRQQLLGVGGVLVWVDPVTGSDDRTVLDELLRDIANAGVWVSAHPDVILKMGTKEVLYRTRDVGWGSEVELYRTPAELRERFPSKLDGGARVIKQYRGNGGIGVWKVERSTSSSGSVLVQGARARDDTVEETSLEDFTARCDKYFTYSGGQGRLIDQPFQPRITDGIARCYLVKNEVVGFCRQHQTTPSRRTGCSVFRRPRPCTARTSRYSRRSGAAWSATGYPRCNGSSTSTRSRYQRCGTPTSCSARGTPMAPTATCSAR